MSKLKTVRIPYSMTIAQWEKQQQKERNSGNGGSPIDRLKITGSQPAIKWICQHCDVEYKTETELKEHYKSLQPVQKDQAVISLDYQSYIDGPPRPKESLYQQACSNDGITIDSWRAQWLDHIKQNTETYDVKKNSAFNEFGKQALKPVIVAGAGPSLKRNVEELKKNQGDMCLVSCLHNFGFFEDHGIKVDYYMNLDAGDITVSEMPEGGLKSEGHYWDKTKDRTLVTALVGNPELIKRWKGKVLFFHTPIPDQSFHDEQIKLTDFNLCFATGGNTLGSALYMAKAVLGANPICFIGADFSFGYDKKFHSWDSPYDKQFSGVIPATDVFGNKTYTWQSYFNFKCYFDYIICGGKGNLPATYYNCTEGGILGAYQAGNIRQLTQMALDEFLSQYNIHKIMPDLVKKAQTDRMATLLF